MKGGGETSQRRTVIALHSASSGPACCSSLQYLYILVQHITPLYRELFCGKYNIKHQACSASPLGSFCSKLTLPELHSSLGAVRVSRQNYFQFTDWPMPRISSSEMGRNPGSPTPWAPSSRLPPVPGHSTGPSLQEVSLPACRRGKSLFDGPAGLAEEATILLREADTNSLVRATDRERK